MSHTKYYFKLALLPALCMSLMSCGQNPFGSGNLGGLQFFAQIGQKMEKPDSIDKEENGKEGAKATVGEGIGAFKRSAKSHLPDEEWLIEKGLIVRGDTLVYYEIVEDKPSEEDPEKLMTGRGEVSFGYDGSGISDLSQVDTTKITDLYSFHFIGEQLKTWNEQVDSVDITVHFSVSTVTDIKPGKTWFWAKNISATDILGRGDTASFVLDELDDDLHTQYGEGHFFDKNSGKDAEGESNSFDFEIQIMHKNTMDENKPYHRYQDNEGIITFMLPWTKNDDADSLAFSIHFYPDYERSGEIHKNSPDGPLLVKFTYNEKTDEGEIIYYNEDGEEIGS